MVPRARVRGGAPADSLTVAPAAALAFAVVGWLAPAGALPAQDDARDVVVLNSGRELRGRVLARYGTDGLVLVQNTTRHTVPWANIASIDTVPDRVAEFLAVRDRLPDNERQQTYLIDWAHLHGIEAMARLQAIDVALRAPDNVTAHTLLGHRRRGSEWLWQHGDDWVRLSDLERFHADWGHPWELESEHFALRCNADLRRSIDTLFDLERLYAYWFEEFGEALQLTEALAPKLPVWVWRDRADFPAWASTKLPYFRPRTQTPLEPSRSFLYFADAQAARPAWLFEVATQHLLYRTLADDPALWTQKDRLCGWAEVGFGQYLERRFGGPAGHAEVGAWRMPEDEGRVVSNQASYTVANLLHRSARQFYITVADNTLFEWAASHLFVAWLLDGGDRELRRAFVAYLRAALHDGKGDSSSAFDRVLGRPIDGLEAPWRQWIREQLPSLPVAPRIG